jgi:hypothetical protein
MAAGIDGTTSGHAEGGAAGHVGGGGEVSQGEAKGGAST